MTVIQNIVKDATGALLPNAQCLIRLVGAPAFDSSTTSETVTVGTVTTDVNGQWSKDLTPVSHYSPAGCYYTVSEPGGSLHAFTVPDAGGPYWLNAVLTVAPTAPEASLGVVRYDADQSTALTAGQQAQARANIGAGTGGGAVASVNGQTGTVVLAASDVGADVSGAAATAQAAAIAASQPVDSDLTAIAALTTTTFGRSLLTQADAAALRGAAGLGTAATQPSTAFDAAGAAAAAQAASQPLDSDLTAIAALTTTSFGRSFLALADAAAGRTLLGLGSLATQSGTFSGTSSGTNTGDQDLSGLVPKSTVTAKGDLIVATGSGAVTNLAVGADGTVPVADSTQAGGVKWATPSAPGRGRPVTGGTEPAWLPGVHFTMRTDLTFAANTTYYTPFYVTNTTTVSGVIVNIITGVGAATCRVGIYPAGLTLQPSAAMVGDVGLSLATSGNVSSAVSWVLPPGRYVVAFNPSASVQLRTPRGAPMWLPADSGFPQNTIQTLTVAATLAGALPSTGTAWSTVATQSLGTSASPGLWYPVLVLASEAA